MGVGGELTVLGSTHCKEGRSTRIRGHSLVKYIGCGSQNMAPMLMHWRLPSPAWFARGMLACAHLSVARFPSWLCIPRISLPSSALSGGTLLYAFSCLFL